MGKVWHFVSTHISLSCVILLQLNNNRKRNQAAIMAAANMLDRNRASASFPNMNHFDLVSSSLQATLLSDDVVVIESEPERNGEFKRFVKLKKSHWVDPKQRRVCKLCLADFGSRNKKLNCRRCGEVFCEKCCCYRRKLSPNCEPSADGHYYRVCYHCSDCGIQGVGQTRKLMDYFEMQKSTRHIIIMREMQRLVRGFEANVKASRLDLVVKDTMSTIKVPGWQMSERWLESKEVDWCGMCSGKFTMFMQKHHCRLCGAVFCHKCCSQDLLLYYNDQNIAEWAIIRVVGCPDAEPNVCVYLKVCSHCRQEAENLQVREFNNAKVNSGQAMETFSTLSSIVENLRSCRKKINSELLLYQEMVEGLVDGQGRFKEVSESGQNVVKVFAKLQLDVTDLFSHYVSYLQSLKKINMISQNEIQLLRNISKVHYEFYQSNMATFKCFKENLSKTLPTEMLRGVQDYADKHSLTSTCITTRLLGLELLNICTRFKLEATIAQRISELDKACKDDLESFVKRFGEDWEDDNKCINAIVKERFQSGKLIRLNSSFEKLDNVELAKSLRRRCFDILSQVQTQLLAKSSETKFSETKSILANLISSLE